MHLPVSGACNDDQCHMSHAGGDTGVTRWSSVAEESASVTASVLTTRPALTTDARIPARAQTQAAASTPTAGWDSRVTFLINIIVSGCQSRLSVLVSRGLPGGSHHILHLQQIKKQEQLLLD